MIRHLWLLTAAALACVPAGASAAGPQAFFAKHCTECHDADTHKGNLDLTALKPDFANPETFARWVKVYDRVESGEMPPRKRERPTTDERRTLLDWLDRSLTDAEDARIPS